MKDFLIVYSSKTGNTEIVAKKFYEVAGERCDLAAVKQVPVVDDYKVIFAGYWVDKGEPDKDMQEFLQTLDNKKVVLFQTLGAEAYSEHGISSLANAGRYLSTGCKVVGTLSIRGAIDPKLIETMMKMPEGHSHAPTEESKKRWKDASTHPDEADLQAAGEYIQKFITFYDRFYK